MINLLLTTNDLVNEFFYYKINKNLEIYLNHFLIKIILNFEILTKFHRRLKCD